MEMDSDLAEFISEAAEIRRHGPRTPLEKQVLAGLCEIERLRDLHRRNVGHLSRRKYEDVGHHCGWRVIAEGMAERSKRGLPTKNSEPTYPCDDCGAPRTKSQGGEIFTVCDDCWDKRRELEKNSET